MTQRFGFILEQTLGHSTYDANLRAAVHSDPQVAAVWAAIDFAERGRFDQLPLLRNWTLRAGRQARRHLVAMRRAGPLDALLFHTQTVAVLALDWLRQIPSVISLDATPRQLDGMGAAYDHATDSPLIEQLKARLHRSCYRAARHLVTWSQWTADSLVRDYGVSAEKVSVVAPGVAIDFWRRPATPVARSGPVQVLFVGGDFRRKGGWELLEAVRALPEGSVELHVVTGTVLAEQPGMHTYYGIQPNSAELRALYHRCDLFCLPTRGDCMPLVLSEASAAGLPVISTAIGAIPEVVRDGETGLLVPPGDTAALIRALRSLVESPARRRAMGARAAAMAARQLDARYNARRVLEILKQVAERGEGPITSSLPEPPLERR